MRVTLAAALIGAALAAHGQKLPSFPAQNVPETFFGTKVDDPYRALENTTAPDVAAWMKAHSDHGRAALDGLKGMPALKKRVVELDNSVEARVQFVRRTADGSLFFTRRGAKDNTFKL